MDGQHLAGRVSLAERRAGRVSSTRACRLLPGQWSWPVRHGRQRLGVDQGLVRGGPSARSQPAVLRAGQSARCRGGIELRPQPARPARGAQSDQGRLVPVRTELLPALSAGSALSAGDRHGHQPHWLPLRAALKPTSTRGIAVMNRRNLFLSTAKAALAAAFGSSWLSGKANAQPAASAPAAIALGAPEPAASEGTIYGTLGSPDATISI